MCERKAFIKEIVFDFAGAFFFVIGIYNFAGNSEFVTGGISGISLIVYHVTRAPIGVVSLLLQIPLICLCLWIFGKRYLFSSLKTAVIFSLVLDHIVIKLPVYQGNPILAAVCAGVFSGVGLALVYGYGGCTGGTDYLLMALKYKYPHLTLGQISIVMDGIIIGVGALIFQKMDAAILGVICVYVSAAVIDRIAYRMGAGKLVLAISKEKNRIAEMINEETSRGCTFVKAYGGYKNTYRDLILCACSNNQSVIIKNLISKVDEKAFVIILNSSEVFGEGFKKIIERESNYV